MMIRNLLKSASLVMMFTLLLVGCSDDEEMKNGVTELEEAHDFAEAFLTKFYDTENVTVDLENPDEMIDYMNEFKAYLTEEEFDELNTTRQFLIPLEITEARNSPLTIKDMDVAAESETDDEIKATFTVQLASLQDEASGDIEVKGDMTIEREEDDKLMISRYYHNGLPLDESELEE